MFTNIPGGYITPNGNVVMMDGSHGVVTPNNNVIIHSNEHVQQPKFPVQPNVSKPNSFLKLLDKLKK